jgi:hypothetical protein
MSFGDTPGFPDYHHDDVPRRFCQACGVELPIGPCPTCRVVPHSHVPFDYTALDAPAVLRQRAEDGKDRLVKAVALVAARLDVAIPEERSREERRAIAEVIVQELHLRGLL